LRQRGDRRLQVRVLPLNVRRWGLTQYLVRQKHGDPTTL